MSKFLVISLLIFSTQGWANTSSQVLDCAYNYRKFAENISVYFGSQRIPGLRSIWEMNERSYLMTAADLGLIRTAGLVSDSGFYKVSYSEEDQKNAIAAKSDYISLRIKGGLKSDLFASVMDPYVFAYGRRYMNYSFGSSVYWERADGVTYVDSQAIPMAAEETNILMQKFAKEMNQRLNSIQQSLTSKQRKIGQRIERLEHYSIPEAIQRIAKLNQEKSDLERSTPTQQDEINKYAIKYKEQTDEVIKEALDAKISELTGELDRIQSRIDEIRKSLKSEEQLLADDRKWLVAAESELKAENEAIKPLMERYQNQVIESCSVIPGIL